MSKHKQSMGLDQQGKCMQNLSRGSMNKDDKDDSSNIILNGGIGKKKLVFRGIITKIHK